MAVREGFSPTFPIVMSESFRQAAATEKNAADEISEGTLRSRAVSSESPETLDPLPFY